MLRHRCIFRTLPAASEHSTPTLMLGARGCGKTDITFEGCCRTQTFVLWPRSSWIAPPVFAAGAVPSQACLAQAMVLRARLVWHLLKQRLRMQEPTELGAVLFPHCVPGTGRTCRTCRMRGTFRRCSALPLEGLGGPETLGNTQGDEPVELE